MAYQFSKIDNDNTSWFANDSTCSSLMSINLREGKLRGLNPVRLDFSYPITALAGENGSGKSTLLAMAACAYHNRINGYTPYWRDKNYYTLSDFFYQSQSDIAPEGIEVWNQFLHNNWTRLPAGPGWQRREKKQGGRWTNYDRRVARNVIYFGINRVVPHYERSVYCSYRRKFEPADFDFLAIDKICEMASRIIGKQYSSFSIHQHSKYRLPVVECGDDIYSGFNMGAGENAVFEILTTAFEAGKGALLIIDELELGLHEKAQRRLINELKRLCRDTHCQIICSTHSPVILESLPPSARYFIESGPDYTTVIPGISPAYATGKLGSGHSDELDIFVEDSVGQSLTTEILTHDLRARTTVLQIGSSEAIIRQLAARFREKRNNCIALLDGDKRTEKANARTKFKNYLETQYGNSTEEEVDIWINSRLHFLPGETWPESWALTKALEHPNVDRLSALWGTDPSFVRKALQQGQLAGKHNEFFRLSRQVHHSVDRVRSDVFRIVGEREFPDFEEVRQVISNALEML